MTTKPDATERKRRYQEFLDYKQQVKNDMLALEKEMDLIEQLDWKTIFLKEDEAGRLAHGYKFTSYLVSFNRRAMSLRESLKTFKGKTPFTSGT